MSWKEKSENSFKATNKLLQDSFCNTSVHCSYYSCLQLMYHILSEYLGMRDDEIESESKDDKSSHVWLINKVTRQLKSIRSKEEARIFSDEVHTLKKNRIIADYGKSSINTDQAEKLRDLSYKINKYLTESFSL